METTAIEIYKSHEQNILRAAYAASAKNEEDEEIPQENYIKYINSLIKRFDKFALNSDAIFYAKRFLLHNYDTTELNEIIPQMLMYKNKIKISNTDLQRYIDSDLTFNRDMLGQQSLVDIFQDLFIPWSINNSNKRSNNKNMIPVLPLVFESLSMMTIEEVNEQFANNVDMIKYALAFKKNIITFLPAETSNRICVVVLIPEKKILQIYCPLVEEENGADLKFESIKTAANKIFNYYQREMVVTTKQMTISAKKRSDCNYLAIYKFMDLLLGGLMKDHFKLSHEYENEDMAKFKIAMILMFKSKKLPFKIKPLEPQRA